MKRLTGLQKDTFDKMMEILHCANKDKLSRGGKPSETCLEDKLLMALEYWREYRTYFHISKSVEKEINEKKYSLITKSVSMEEIKSVCYSENVMTQKSTFFYPKVVCGFIFSSIDN